MVIMWGVRNRWKNGLPMKTLLLPKMFDRQVGVFFAHRDDRIVEYALQIRIDFTGL